MTKTEIAVDNINSLIGGLNSPRWEGVHKLLNNLEAQTEIELRGTVARLAREAHAINKRDGDEVSKEVRDRLAEISVWLYKQQ